jgi:hypothetical protein
VSVYEQIDAYIASQPHAKGDDLRALHDLVQGVMPGCRLRFLDGKDADGKTISNPNIGYGSYLATLAGGRTREFYQIGLSGNTSGISVYILGIPDRKYLAETFGPTIGKASVTGYCIKFTKLADIDLDVLTAAVRAGLAASAPSSD